MRLGTDLCYQRIYSTARFDLFTYIIDGVGYLHIACSYENGGPSQTWGDKILNIVVGHSSPVRKVESLTVSHQKITRMFSNFCWDTMGVLLEHLCLHIAILVQCVIV